MDFTPSSTLFLIFIYFFVCFTILNDNKRYSAFSKRVQWSFRHWPWRISLTRLIYTYNKYIFSKIIKSFKRLFTTFFYLPNSPSHEIKSRCAWKSGAKVLIFLHSGNFYKYILLHKGELPWQLLLILYYILMFI